MARRVSKYSRMYEEMLEQMDEVRNILRSYDFDLDDCEVDEYDCAKEYGEELYRIYQLLSELEQILKEE